MICFFLFSFYVINSFSISTKLDRLSALDVTERLEKSPKSIVFVSDDEELLKFAYPAIEKYKDQVQFFLTSPDEVPPSFYTTNPSIIPFKYTKPLNIDSPPLESTSFSYWVERIIDPTHYTIAVPIQLEKVLNGSAPSLFEIDGNKFKTENIEKGITIFKTTSSLFQKFHIKVNPGLYVYRPQDRQLIPYNGSFALQSLSHLTHFTLIERNPTKIVMAFIIDEWGEKSREYYELLESLSNIYGSENYYYTFIDTPNIQKLIKGIGIYEIKKPIFIISNISSYPSNKWIYNSTIEENVTLINLKKFVSDVISDKIIPTIISEPVPNYTTSNSPPVQPVVNTNFADLVYDDSCEAFVMFEQEKNVKAKIISLLFKAVAKIFNGQYSKFYIFDTTKNDIPPDVPEITSYPMVVVWPAGKKDEPKVFTGEFTFQNIMEFVKKRASHKISIPNIDPKQVLSVLNSKINKLLGKGQPEENQDL